MSMKDIVSNELVEDSSAVWRLKSHETFGYSDGTGSERYLNEVFTSVTDLSCRSTELEAYIKDWPSEYHLTSKRSQLLSGFTFDRKLRVLEVGCGCGAISRHLGESFDQVISVEGNINRARLAKARTRDLPSISVICAPFQKLQFVQKFDLIFCIGVFEYSSAFIDGADPYDAALKYFQDMLSPDGILIIAIENQFGLKYFNGAREDHLGIPFEGLEGYHKDASVARTFGKTELEDRIGKYFSKTEFFYPFPDYKIPDCVLSAEFLASGLAGEMVSQMQSSDYSGKKYELWDEGSTALELSRNRMLEFFSNSFLVVASKGNASGVAFEQLGIHYGSGRRRTFATQTRIVKVQDGINVEKRRLHNDQAKDAQLSLLETDSAWIRSPSIFTQVRQLAQSRRNTIEQVLQPAQRWKEALMQEAQLVDGTLWLEGNHIDSIWPNVYNIGEECRIIDREWIWKDKIRLNVVVIRAIYDFLTKMEISGQNSPSLTGSSGRTLIQRMAAAMGVQLNSSDFDQFIQLETQLAFLAAGSSPPKQAFFIKWFLLHRPSRRFFRLKAPIAHSLYSRIAARLSNLR
jgi:SAM-dependent methyltransferase